MRSRYFRHYCDPTLFLIRFFKFAVLSLFFLQSSSIMAWELGLGLASTEEGDDRLRPSLGIHVGITPNYYGRYYIYGREFGPVKETTMTLSANRRFNLFNSQNIKAGLGIAFLQEHYQIKYTKEEDKKHNKNDAQTNVGLSTGLFYDLPFAGKFYASLGWESAIFIAGPNGFFFLSTGRKQFVSLMVGVNL